MAVYNNNNDRPRLLPLFNGRNYDNLSFHVKLMLEEEKLIPFKTSQTAKKTHTDEWALEDCKCRRLVVETTADFQLETVKNSTAALDVDSSLKVC